MPLFHVFPMDIQQAKPSTHALGDQKPPSWSRQYLNMPNAYRSLMKIWVFLIVIFAPFCQLCPFYLLPLCRYLHNICTNIVCVQNERQWFGVAFRNNLENCGEIVRYVSLKRKYIVILMIFITGCTAQPVMKMSSKWWHFGFNVPLKCGGRLAYIVR